MRRPSVAVFLRTLRGGGAERVMLRLADGLRADGYAPMVVAVDASEASPGWVPEGVEVVDLGARSLAGSLVPLRRFIRRRRPDVLLSGVSGANVIALAACRLARVDVPVVVTEHNTASSQRADASTLRRRRITPWLMRRTYPSAAAIVAVSQGVADDLVEYLDLPAGSVRAIPNPVVTDDVLSMAAKRLPNSWERKIGDVPLVLSVGRIVPHKDHAMLLRAFAAVRQMIPEAHLVILGEGDGRPEVERLSRQLGLTHAVSFAGFQTNPYAWLAHAHVVALTSRYEGLPTILIEALACGARVVSTDCPSGPAEILENGQWGSLVPVGDADRFAAELVAALSLGRWEVPPETALERYRLDRVVEQYRAVIDPLLARPEAKPTASESRLTE